MQFVADGPEVPAALLQAHEEGRVVFFCGAGISYPANLPGFEGLVDRIYKKLGATPSVTEEAACKRSQYDAALDLLERRVPGQRLAVRNALARSLRPNLKKPGATGTHQSLLQLARHKSGSFRLVTTNFDRIFEKAAKQLRLKVPSYHAPLLPIAKRSRWSGLVYLHGILPTRLDEASLNRLIVTSGDFGLAYLTERWASRFVTDLFCNYIVCFVGYTINDPVLRYMMDALAADRMLGENTPQAYAFGGYTASEFHAKDSEWVAKGVTPILYEIPEHIEDHSALHRTLAAWAETYRDGITGKEHIVATYASARPAGSTQQDDYVGRMLWAIADPSGLAARRFAEHEPVPSLDWLQSFAELRFGHSDLRRFGVAPFEATDPDLTFSLIRRPAPYSHAPQMALTWWPVGSDWDDVMRNLARWLLRHLDDPNLAMWLMTQGSALVPKFADLVDKELHRLSGGDSSTPNRSQMEMQGGSATPLLRPGMRLLWRLLSANRLKFGVLRLDLYDWIARFHREGLSTPLRLSLRDHLSPKVRVRLRTTFGDEPPERPEEFAKIFDWDLELANDHVQSALEHVVNSESWAQALPLLLHDFVQLLQDARDLAVEVSGSRQADRAYLDLPSISPHWQNRHRNDWTILIELVRDAWLATLEVDAPRAVAFLPQWFALRDPTFKRLALFGAQESWPKANVAWAGWLLSDSGKWLWSIQTRREVLRLFVLRGAQLSTSEAKRLESAIVAGPGETLRGVTDEGERRQAADRAVWLRLAKLFSGRRKFETKAASQKYDNIRQNYPQWALADDESDEFAIWSVGTGDPGYVDRREFHAAPTERAALADWIRSVPREKGFFYEDDWAEICRTRFAVAYGALLDLSRQGEWPIEQWREALQVWSAGRLQRTAGHVALLLKQMPDESFVGVTRAVAWWLDAVTKYKEWHNLDFILLAGRVITLSDDEVGEHSVLAAINHPIGLSTSALLNIWFAGKPNDGEGLPDRLKDAFTRLTDTSVCSFRHGRLVLASRTIALFRVDRRWTTSVLLPLFDWARDSGEALAAWQGFLWSPRIYAPVLQALKQPFLQTSSHYEDLDDYERQYTALLTYCALESVEGFSSEEFAIALAALPQKGLVEVARTLGEAVAAAGDKRADYWQNRVRPFWRGIWPKHVQLASPEVSSALAIAAIAGGDQFPQMLREFEPWLRPSEYPHYILHRLLESDVARKFPGDALSLLDRIITDQPYPGDELERILDSIRSQERWSEDIRLQRLYEYLRQRGH